jgi:hypothetical protein
MPLIPSGQEIQEKVKTHHETSDGHLKDFKIMDERFGHGVAKHEAVFKACCIMVQHGMNNGHPLFDV